MHLENLVLNQFKNYEFLEVNTEASVVCFVGENGSGKTNLLDAIQAAHEREMVVVGLTGHGGRIDGCQIRLRQIDIGRHHRAGGGIARQMLDAADEVILATDSSKFGQEVLDPPNSRQFRITVRVTGPKDTRAWVQALITRG